MKKVRSILRTILFPHATISIIVFLVSLIILVASIFMVEHNSITRYLSYGFAAYGLAIVIIKFKDIKTGFKRIINSKYVTIYRKNYDVRIIVSLVASLIINITYVLFNLHFGIAYLSFFHFTLGLYYSILILIKIFEFRNFILETSEEKEIQRSIRCGKWMIFLDVILVIVMEFIIWINKPIFNDKFVITSLTIYSVVVFIMSIVNIFRYKKFNKPAYYTFRAISLTCACVSLLILENTIFFFFANI